MHLFEFTVVLDRAPVDDDFDTLFDAGLDDTQPEIESGRGLLHVARRADSLAAALLSVAADVRRAGFAVTSVQEEDLVPLKTVAVRLGRSYESVRLLSQGKRGPGGFPAPLAGEGWALYSWAEVASWFAAHYDQGVVPTADERVIAAADHLFRARTLLADTDLTALSPLLATA